MQQWDIIMSFVILLYGGQRGQYDLYRVLSPVNSHKRNAAETKESFGEVYINSDRIVSLFICHSSLAHFNPVTL